MTKPIDKLLSLIEGYNIADKLDDEQKTKIVEDVLTGYRIDDDSRSAWLETNREAMEIIKHCEKGAEADDNNPVYKNAKVIYPLLSVAVIQLASRLVSNIVRNGRVVECAVLGKDEQVPENPIQFAQYQQLNELAQQNPQIQQQLAQLPKPQLVYKKKRRAEAVSSFMNYQLLVESDSWLKDIHKLCHVLASWGTAFRQIYWDNVSKKVCEELIAPEDVVINHNLTCLENARRVTVNHYMSKNDIIEQMRAGYFSEVETDDLDKAFTADANSIDEIDPAIRVHCQFMYADLDDDGYAEPYYAYVSKDLNMLLGMYPAFEASDIDVNPKNGEIIRIKPRLNIVDTHLIDDPEGKFYSLGLNYLLLHQNKSITAILRQLIDAGALSNAASCTGFITNAFKTREKYLEFSLGEFKQVEIVNDRINPQEHIIPLPAREPSQVLMGLLDMLIKAGEKTGFVTDVLMGDMAGQNVPATTMLAIIEQGTRAFKPIVLKLWISFKKGFKMRFHELGKHMDDESKYAVFAGQSIQVLKEDFNDDDIEVVPVADPTESSEAHKYAKMQFIMQLLNPPAMPALNLQENLIELYKGMNYENPERFVSPPQQQAPDPKMLQVQAQAQKQEQDHQIDLMHVENDRLKEENNRLKISLKAQEVKIKMEESKVKQGKMKADAAVDMADARNKDKMANVAVMQAMTEQEKVEVMRQQLNNRKSD
jgi:hypothetical protein